MKHITAYVVRESDSNNDEVRVHSDKITAIATAKQFYGHLTAAEVKTCRVTVETYARVPAEDGQTAEQAIKAAWSEDALDCEPNVEYVGVHEWAVVNRFRNTNGVRVEFNGDAGSYIEFECTEHDAVQECYCNGAADMFEDEEDSVDGFREDVREELREQLSKLGLECNHEIFNEIAEKVGSDCYTLSDIADYWEQKNEDNA